MNLFEPVLFKVFKNWIQLPIPIFTTMFSTTLNLTIKEDKICSLPDLVAFLDKVTGKWT